MTITESGRRYAGETIEGVADAGTLSTAIAVLQASPRPGNASTWAIDGSRVDSTGHTGRD